MATAEQPKPVAIAPAEPLVTITIPLTEALAVGHSLRAIAKSRAFPGSDTARMYRSVGDAMVFEGQKALLAVRK